MWVGIIELLPLSIIGIMARKKRVLNTKERAARDTFMAGLTIKKRKTEKPIIVALIGLVGSGKSSVAHELARRIGAVVIGGDDVRIELRKQREAYDRTWVIAEDAAVEIVRQGGNAILDSDFADEKKRASIRERARKINARVVFVRTICDFDVMVGRILTADYRNRADDFFGGASSKWTGNEQSRGAAVKIREMSRRTPHHYRWANQDGGKWIPKKFRFQIFAEIDTTEPNVWKRNAEQCANRLVAH